MANVSIHAQHHTEQLQRGDRHNVHFSDGCVIELELEGYPEPAESDGLQRHTMARWLAHRRCEHGQGAVSIDDQPAVSAAEGAQPETTKGVEP